MVSNINSSTSSELLRSAPRPSASGLEHTGFWSCSVRRSKPYLYVFIFILFFISGGFFFSFLQPFNKWFCFDTDFFGKLLWNVFLWGLKNRRTFCLKEHRRSSSGHARTPRANLHPATFKQAVCGRSVSPENNWRHPRAMFYQNSKIKYKAGIAQNILPFTFSAQPRMTSSSRRSASYISFKICGILEISWDWCMATTHSKPWRRYLWAFLLLWQN